MGISTQLDPFRAFLPEKLNVKAGKIEQNIQSRFNRLFRSSPLIHRTSYIAMHFFRAGAMVGLASILPFTTHINVSICIVGTTLYRFTSEPPCTMRYAFSAAEGQFAFASINWGIARLTGEVANRTLANQALTLLAFVPAFVWMAGVIKLAMSLDPPMCCHRSM